MVIKNMTQAFSFFFLFIFFLFFLTISFVVFGSIKDYRLEMLPQISRWNLHGQIIHFL
jgi:hypothetical protein